MFYNVFVFLDTKNVKVLYLKIQEVYVSFKIFSFIGFKEMELLKILAYMVLVSTVAMYGADEDEGTGNLDIDKSPLVNTSAAADSAIDVECRLFGKLVTPKISGGCAHFSATSIFSVESASTSED